MTVELLRPTTQHLPSFVAALERGWDPPGTTAAAALERVRTDPDRLLAEAEARDGQGPPVQLPDGSFVRRLPSIMRWIWDGEFCGRISLRWEHGTTELPPTCLGHIGYVVVPWKRRRGYATRALELVLPEARGVGLPFVDIVTDPENVPSQRVILANGGVLVGQFRKPEVFGGTQGLLFRIALGDGG